MAEIILPPEEETPQVPELNIDKPTENSKVITIEFEAKKTNKVSTKDTNQQLYTTDTDAWFEFKETSLEGANGTYSAVFRNRHDGSIFQRTGDVVNGVAYYKIPHQEIKHAGAWRGQIVYTLSNGDTTSREFGYDVKGHMLDGKDVREIVVEDFETLMSQLRNMKDSAEVELANLTQELRNTTDTAEQNETDRQAFFDDLVEDIDGLQSNYQELLDTGVLQTNINTKLEALEEEYAPKLTEVTAQLAEKAKKVDLEVQKSRIDTLLELPEGATTNDGRLEGITVGADGHVYDSPGEAVRSQLNKKTDVQGIGTVLSNGDLSKGTEGWHLSAGHSLKVVDGHLTYGVSGSDQWAGFRSQEVSFSKDDKVYLRATVISDVDSDNAINRISIPSTGIFYEVRPLKADVPRTFSTVLNIPETGIYDFLFRTGKEVVTPRWSNITIINLTEKFGKGNEPSVNQLDNLYKFETSTLTKDDLIINVLSRLNYHDYTNIENIVRNGDFSKGVGGWIGRNGLITTENDNALIYKMSLVEGERIEQEFVQVTEGHKYYVRAEILPKYSVRTYLQLASTNVGIVYSDKNRWNILSGVVTSQVTDNSLFRVYHQSEFGEEGYQKDDIVKFRNVMAINLTKAFGEGNEPSKEAMDDLVSDIGHFNGRLSADKSSVNLSFNLLDFMTTENELWGK